MPRLVACPGSDGSRLPLAMKAPASASTAPTSWIAVRLSPNSTYAMSAATGGAT